MFLPLTFERCYFGWCCFSLLRWCGAAFLSWRWCLLLPPFRWCCSPSPCFFRKVVLIGQLLLLVVMPASLSVFGQFSHHLPPSLPHSLRPAAPPQSSVKREMQSLKKGKREETAAPPQRTRRRQHLHQGGGLHHRPTRGRTNTTTGKGKGSSSTHREWRKHHHSRRHPRGGGGQAATPTRGYWHRPKKEGKQVRQKGGNAHRQKGRLRGTSRHYFQIMLFNVVQFTLLDSNFI